MTSQAQKSLSSTGTEDVAQSDVPRSLETIGSGLAASKLQLIVEVDVLLDEKFCTTLKLRKN